VAHPRLSEPISWARRTWARWFGRTWRVYAHADGDFRKWVEDIANLKTRNDKGEMVPIGSIVKISQTYGPDPVLRYNGYLAADFIGEANPPCFPRRRRWVRWPSSPGECCPTA
jgi:multidrug efflux pump subunit AcrB